MDASSMLTARDPSYPRCSRTGPRPSPPGPGHPRQRATPTALRRGWVCVPWRTGTWPPA